MDEQRLQKIRAGLDGRRGLREQAQCDASLHLRSGQEWPCLLPWHNGYHVYDVAIDADRDLAELLAEVERLRGIETEALDATTGFGELVSDNNRLMAEVGRLRKVAEAAYALIDRDPSDGPLIDALEAAVHEWREARHA